MVFVEPVLDFSYFTLKKANVAYRCTDSRIFFHHKFSAKSWITVLMSYLFIHTAFAVISTHAFCSVPQWLVSAGVAVVG